MELLTTMPIEISILFKILKKTLAIGTQICMLTFHAFFSSSLAG